MSSTAGDGGAPGGDAGAPPPYLTGASAPSASEPAASEPAASQPAASEPASSEPAASAPPIAAPYAPPQGPWPPQPPPPVSPTAITTLVLGTASIFLVAVFGIGGLVAGTVAVIFGHRELRRLHPADTSGRTMTIIGLVAGYCGAAIGLLFVLIFSVYIMFVLGALAIFTLPVVVG